MLTYYLIVLIVISVPVTIDTEACSYHLPSTEVRFYVGISNVLSIVMDAVNFDFNQLLLNAFTIQRERVHTLCTHTAFNEVIPIKPLRSYIYTFAKPLFDGISPEDAQSSPLIHGSNYAVT